MEKLRAVRYAAGMSELDFERVVEQGRALQARFPALRLVAVGGTAAALHCGHRVSLDVDAVSPVLQDSYEHVLAALEAWEGWTTNRLTPRVLILGERQGVELGLRQQRRPVPLRTVLAQGLVVPTPLETLRTKAFLVSERRALRDYVDVAALTVRLGDATALAGLRFLNLLYPPQAPQTAVTRFAEACEGEPFDLPAAPLASYKGLQPPFTSWTFVAAQCQRLGRALLKLELDEALPRSLDDGFQAEPLS
jgi:hypothetical protein